MSGEEERFRILTFLKQRERAGDHPGLEDFCVALGLSEEDVGDQLDILDTQGAIEARRDIGGGASPFLKPHGKLLIETLEAKYGKAEIRNQPRQVQAPSNEFEWDVFIAHASEDKEKFVRPLAEALGKYVDVWFDEFTLTVGDSLRRKIDEGLARSRFGVVVLSPNFFAKKWPQDELDGLVVREHDGTKVILPVWLDIDQEGVAKHSPMLAGRLAAKASDGLESVVNDLLLAMEGALPAGTDNPTPAAPPVTPWPDRAGAPQFRLNPGIHQGRLLCEFEISDASPAPGGIEAKWTGSGTKMDWTKPMRENVRRGSPSQKYQMKPADMDPQPRSDEVTFEIRFNLEDGPHGGRWKWPLRQHERKGHWILDSHLGSGVHQPSLEDAW